MALQMHNALRSASRYSATAGLRQPVLRAATLAVLNHDAGRASA
jgi:hypothetical protein